MTGGRCECRAVLDPGPDEPVDAHVWCGRELPAEAVLVSWPDHDSRVIFAHPDCAQAICDVDGNAVVYVRLMDPT